VVAWSCRLANSAPDPTSRAVTTCASPATLPGVCARVSARGVGRRRHIDHPASPPLAVFTPTPINGALTSLRAAATRTDLIRYRFYDDVEKLCDLMRWQGRIRLEHGARHVCRSGCSHALASPRGSKELSERLQAVRITAWNSGGRWTETVRRCGNSAGAERRPSQTVQASTSERGKMRLSGGL
jgi:hypothetical protein